MLRTRLETRRHIVADPTEKDQRQDETEIDGTPSHESEAASDAESAADRSADMQTSEPTVDDESRGADDPLAEIHAALDAEQAEEEFKRPAAELKAIIEAMIFASPEPLTPKALIKLPDN